MDFSCTPGRHVEAIAGWAMEVMEGYLGRLIEGEVLPLAQAPGIAPSTGGDWRQDACRDSERHCDGPCGKGE